MGMLLKVHQPIHLDNSKVIVKVPSVEVWMILDVENIHLQVGVELAVIMDVPLPQPDPELLGSVLVDAVGGSQEMVPVYKSSSTGVDIVILVLL